MRLITGLFETLAYLCLLLCIAFVYCAYFNPQAIAHVVCSLRTDTPSNYTACRLQY